MEDVGNIRTVQTYNTAATIVDIQNTGIKEACQLNKLTTFPAAFNLVQDIMHDILEGICKYDIVLVCKHCITNKMFTLEVLNKRIQSINYGYHDKLNKPPIITCWTAKLSHFKLVKCGILFCIFQ